MNAARQRRPRTVRTLVLAAAAVLALVSSIGFVSPRSRTAVAPPSESLAAEPEPAPSPLVAPRPPCDGVAPTSRVPDAKDPAWRAGDAGGGAENPPPASTPTEPGLATLEVRVTRAGRPAPGATIELLHEPRAPASPSAPELHGADGTGLLRLALAPGKVRAAAWLGDACARPASAPLEADAPAQLELELEPAFPVAGRVVDARTGAPIEGASVALWTFAERDVVRTGADGSFLHPRFPSGAPSQQIAVHAEGYGVTVRYLRVPDERSWKLYAAAPGEENLTGSGTPWIELALVPEVTVRGRVTDAGGRPLAGARISAEGFFHAMASVAARDSAVATSDAKGAFELSGLRSDIGHSLLAESEGFAHALRELEAGCTEQDLGTLVLERETVLAGAAIDELGFPLADVEVVLLLEADEPPPPGSSALDVPARVQGRELRVRTSAEGAFLFEHLTARPLSLRIETDGARAELALVPRADGSFESPLLVLSPGPLALAERTR